MASRKIFPSASTVLVAALTTALLSPSSIKSTSLTALKRLVALVLVLNWRGMPGGWHVRVFDIIPITWWKIKRLGLEAATPVGKSPFDFRTVTKGYVSIDQADFNLHLSNSSYAAAWDKARFQWIVELGGASIAIEGVYAPLAQTEYNFLKEIPMFKAYEIEVVLGSWDDKWWYCTGFFTTKSPSGICILHCIATAKLCLKSSRSRLSIPPGHIFSIAGMGPRANWDRSVALRKANKGTKWLMFAGGKVAEKSGREVRGKDRVEGEKGWEEEGDGMQEFEELRKERLEEVLRLGCGSEMSKYASL